MLLLLLDNDDDINSMQFTFLFFIFLYDNMGNNFITNIYKYREADYEFFLEINKIEKDIQNIEAQLSEKQKEFGKLNEEYENGELSYDNYALHKQPYVTIIADLGLRLESLRGKLEYIQKQKEEKLTILNPDNIEKEQFKAKTEKIRMSLTGLILATAIRHEITGSSKEKIRDILDLNEELEESPIMIQSISRGKSILKILRKTIEKRNFKNFFQKILDRSISGNVLDENNSKVSDDFIKFLLKHFKDKAGYDIEIPPKKRNIAVGQVLFNLYYFIRYYGISGNKLIVPWKYYCLDGCIRHDYIRGSINHGPALLRSYYEDIEYQVSENKYLSMIKIYRAYYGDSFLIREKLETYYTTKKFLEELSNEINKNNVNSNVLFDMRKLEDIIPKDMKVIYDDKKTRKDVYNMIQKKYPLKCGINIE